MSDEGYRNLRNSEVPHETAMHYAFACDPDESAGLADDAVLQTYTLQLIGSPEGLGVVSNESLATALLGGATGPLREAEENLTDLLPDGYKVVIKEWDQP